LPAAEDALTSLPDASRALSVCFGSVATSGAAGLGSAAGIFIKTSQEVSIREFNSAIFMELMTASRFNYSNLSFPPSFLSLSSPLRRFIP
jgi:hypothetical protein